MTSLILAMFLMLAPPRIATAAEQQIRTHVIYDGAYRRIAFPGGDVPVDRGACTDVIVRAYRAIGIDLQKSVYEDRRASHKATDTNIDHRRVENLRIFFSHQGASLPITSRSADYLPGDVVAWSTPPGTHIGIVVGPGVVVHSKGRGARREAVLFAWKIIGHYRYRVE